MKIHCWAIGKGHERYIRPGVEDYTRRINNYFPAEWLIIHGPKNAGELSKNDLKKKESIAILERLKKDDILVSLDEKGRQFSSTGLAQFIQTKANESSRNLIFIIGGAYGLDHSVLEQSAYRWSLSELTFPHQLVRLILVEQLYRACTILRNEKYHH